MEKELDPAIIKATQMSLGKYVKRPQLTEKLLRKPPFRFLHDIVTNVMKTTGFFEGLFEEPELLSDNVKDRESKILFLTKVITVLGLTTGETLKVKPSKIVAGQEPDKTNELLQNLAHALDKKLTTTEAIKKFKDNATSLSENNKKGTEIKKPQKKSDDSNKLISRSREKITPNKKDVNIRTSKNEKDKTRNIKSKQNEEKLTDKESFSKQILQNRTISKKPPIENNAIQDNRNDSSQSIEEKSHIQTSLSKKELESKSDSKLSATVEDSHEQNVNSLNTKPNTLKSSAIPQDLLHNEDNTVNEHLEKQKSAFNATNLQRENADVENIKPNRESIMENKIDAGQSDIKSNLKGHEIDKTNEITIAKDAEVNSTLTNNIFRPQSTRPSSSRPGAPRLRDKHDNTITENENLLGKVNIITETSLNEEEEEPSIVIVEEKTITEETQDEHGQLHMSANQHGHLVKQILDSQKEYSRKTGRTEIEWEIGAQKARDTANKDVEQLRYDIQAVSRVSNPLGKLLDHIQEDVEVMRQELNQWTKTYEDTIKKLSKQRAQSEETLLPLHTMLKQLDTHILEKRDKINDLKIIIHKNSYRIEKLLSNGIVQ